MTDGGADQGSVGMGFALGFFCGLIGLLIAMFAMKDKPLTKKGAIYGFVAQLVIGCVLGIVMGVVVPMLGAPQ